MKFKNRLTFDLIQVVLVLSWNQLLSVRAADCSQYDKDICLCHEQDDCTYDEEAKECVESDAKFSKYTQCLRRDVFYAFGTQFCEVSENKGKCHDGVIHHAINVGGKAMTVKGVKYDGDTRQSGTNDCIESFSFWSEVFKTVLEGTPKDRALGKCVGYQIPVGDDGLYELKISASPLDNRCMDIKLGGQKVGIDVDMWQLGFQLQCVPPVDLIIKYVVDKKAKEINIKGQSESLPLSKELKLEFCYGRCGNNKNAVYSVNAFSVVRFVCKGCPLPTSPPEEKPQKAQNNKPQKKSPAKKKKKVAKEEKEENDIREDIKTDTVVVGNDYDDDDDFNSNSKGKKKGSGNGDGSDGGDGSGYGGGSGGGSEKDGDGNGNSENGDGDSDNGGGRGKSKGKGKGGRGGGSGSGAGEGKGRGKGKGKQKSRGEDDSDSRSRGKNGKKKGYKKKGDYDDYNDEESVGKQASKSDGLPLTKAGEGACSAGLLSPVLGLLGLGC